MEFNFETIEDQLEGIMDMLVPKPIKVLPVHPNAVIPKRATEGSAGMDLYCVEGVTIAPGEWELVPTGLKMAIPMGYEVQIRPRSGLALKQGVTVLNTPGTIDSDYRGEIGVILINHSKVPVIIAPGERVAQMVVGAVAYIDVEKVESLDETDRGEGGFGSTGKK